MNNIVILKHINLMLSWIDDVIESVNKNKDLKIIKAQLVSIQLNLKQTKNELLELYNVSI